MARCEECLHYELCSYNAYEQAKYFGKDKEIYITIKNNTTCKFFKPTADVVLKSEVDRLVDKWIGEENLTQDEKTLRLIEALRDEAKRYERYYFNHEYDKLIGEAKAEVAREIFAAIEFDIHNLDFDREETRAIAIEGVIAKCKKEYTEGEQDGN